MAGHSKWANIQHRKGRQDKLRSKLFSKLAKDIAIASKIGGPDPDMNPRLRLAIANAKGQSMPKDNIKRAVDKGAGGEGADYEEIRYEGYGPGGVAMIVFNGGLVIAIDLPDDVTRLLVKRSQPRLAVVHPGKDQMLLREDGRRPMVPEQLRGTKSLGDPAKFDFHLGLLPKGRRPGARAATS